ncbi:uncharacterized protein O3C94_012771 isoform 2-T2 [Discoglossus pictus]
MDCLYRALQSWLLLSIMAGALQGSNSQFKCEKSGYVQCGNAVTIHCNSTKKLLRVEIISGHDFGIMELVVDKIFKQVVRTNTTKDGKIMMKVNESMAILTIYKVRIRDSNKYQLKMCTRYGHDVYNINLDIDDVCVPEISWGSEPGLLVCSSESSRRGTILWSDNKGYEWTGTNHIEERRGVYYLNSSVKLTEKDANKTVCCSVTHPHVPSKRKTCIQGNNVSSSVLPPDYYPALRVLLGTGRTSQKILISLAPLVLLMLIMLLIIMILLLYCFYPKKLKKRVRTQSEGPLMDDPPLAEA